MRNNDNQSKILSFMILAGSGMILFTVVTVDVNTQRTLFVIMVLGNGVIVLMGIIGQLLLLRLEMKK